MFSRHSVRIAIAISGVAIIVTGCGMTRARRLAGSDITLPQSRTTQLLQSLSTPCDKDAASTPGTQERPACTLAPNDTADRHSGPQPAQKIP